MRETFISIGMRATAERLNDNGFGHDQGMIAMPQSLETLLGKMLRIHIDKGMASYTIPPLILSLFFG